MTNVKIFAIFLSLLSFVAHFVSSKTASKAGIATVSKATSSATSEIRSSQKIASTVAETYSSVNGSSDATARLKTYLLSVIGYDKSLRPVRHQNNKTYVEYDLTYRQVLELNEKSQILKSLFFTRMSWNDNILKWNPSEFENITQILLPATDVWMPDIVCYEEVGQKSYSPRIAYLTVHHYGRVRYAEPTVLETSCSVNIAKFPFDYQACSLTLTSWALPSDKLDILTARPQESLTADISAYFVSTGEWMLSKIDISKRSEDFSQLVVDDATPAYSVVMHHLGNEVLSDTKHVKKLFMNPRLKVEDVAPDRTTKAYWSDVQYTYTFKRNSSLHMQSMLFPALLLVTISILGFYLPPDSGERIGLQITILLTFMVFLLTVRDMFPASTGPYLGVYYVYCMTLLGCNIFMTVLILRLHYFSESIFGQTDAPLPLWVRICLTLCGKSFAYHHKKQIVKENSNLSKETELRSLFLRNVEEAIFRLKLIIWQQKTPPSSQKDNSVVSTEPNDRLPPHGYDSFKKLPLPQSGFILNGESDDGCLRATDNVLEEQYSCKTQNEDIQSKEKQSDSSNSTQVKPDRDLSENQGKITNCANDVFRKSISQDIDKLFLRLYIILITLGHATILLIALLS
ncbi:5-hydroxytryptamine receptor 3A-like [Clavelina lepadiformis]|uniref:5-hydroxytryptamine receptor 3A-like n=1 Tax=Clavelina lepadiformis TaxID=159417 RepID=UPI004042FDC5